MDIVHNESVKVEASNEVTMRTFFDKSLFKGARTTFGKVIIPPGVRVPEKGMGKHNEDEYSIILQGTLKTESGGKEYRVRAGDATYIPKDEPHYAINDGDEDCIIVYALVKRT